MYRELCRCLKLAALSNLRHPGCVQPFHKISDLEWYDIILHLLFGSTYSWCSHAQSDVESHDAILAPENSCFLLRVLVRPLVE